MARKVALINMKGGVGKSTLTVNLAWEIATAPWNKNVLVVDLDPQFNCSQYMVGGRRMRDMLSGDRPTVWDIFEQRTTVPGRPSTVLDPSDAIIRVFPSRPRRGVGVLDLIPSQLELSQTLRNPAGKEHLLREAIEQVEEDYDLVLIDCAPTESVLTTSAYLIAEHILIPVRPEYLATIGLPLLEQSFNQFLANYGCEPPGVLGLVFNMVSGYSPEEATSKRSVRQEAGRSGWPIFDVEVPYSRSFPSGARQGRPMFDTPYARYNVRDDVHDFASEFAERIDL